ncbi:MAG: 50S ribosomal protein L6 [Candidatus Lokiarchaeota archaeon]|nr:50S ribosomal protein L6 [Candidatus Lokiarchaeota archaeon]
MVKQDYIEQSYEFPKNIDFTLKEKILTVKGSLGELIKDFSHARKIDIQIKDRAILFSCAFPKRKERALVNTLAAHVKNMVDGVLNGPYIIKMKIVYSHFPITVKTEGNQVLIENFLGERAPRRALIFGKNTKVKVDGDDVVVESINIEEAGQTSANIRKTCKIKNKDPRTFQDGIFQYQKLLNETVIWNLKF